MRYDMSGASRFEFRSVDFDDRTGSSSEENTSHVFWSGKRFKIDVVMHFGPVGTDGEWNIRSLGNEELAEEHLKARIQEKIEKGYTQVR